MKTCVWYADEVDTMCCATYAMLPLRCLPSFVCSAICASYNMQSLPCNCPKLCHAIYHPLYYAANATESMPSMLCNLCYSI